MKFNINILKKIGITVAALCLGIYLFFLLLPFILTPVLNSYTDQISDIIKDSTGYEAKIDGLGVSTSFKFSAGISAKEFALYIPNEEKPFLDIQGFKLRLSVLPILKRKIRFQDAIAQSLNVSLKVKDGGAFTIFDFLKESQKKEGETPENISLPLGFELSNTLPDVKINDYRFEFIDEVTSKSYFVEGEELHITDFVLDRHVKVSTRGKVVFDNSLISNYDIKIYNKIMPDIKLHELVFPEKTAQENNQTDTAQSYDLPFNIIDIFKSVNNHKLHADILMDVKTSGTFAEPHQRGHFRVEGLSVAVNGKSLPESYADLRFKGTKTDVDSIFFTSNDEKEKTQIIGTIRSGKKPTVDLTLRSNAKINNIIRLADSIAQSFGVNDLKTISATGSIDADFNINSDLKKVLSNGYLKINPSSIKYGLYNISVDNITADVNLDNNNININKSGFSILGHPLKLSGSVKSDTQTDLKLTADNLDLTSLLTSIGQSSILNGYKNKVGTLSLIVLIKGKLNKLDLNITANGGLSTGWIMSFLPSDVRSMFPYTGSLPFKANITGDLKTQNIVFDMNANSSNYIKFADIDLLRGKTTQIHSDMKYSGDILSFSNSSVKAGGKQVATLSGDIYKLTSNPKLNLNINVPDKVSFPIWGMGISNISAYGNASVTGNLDNPHVKGIVNIPDISIKDMDFALTNLIANLNGNVLYGSATADKFKFGGIVGTKLSSDFSLKNYSDFYLKNIQSDAFSGKVSGELSYSIPTTAIKLKLSGKGLNSTDAVYGAAGIKNALTGTMGFDTDLTMHGVTDKEIINSMKGNVNFNIDDGRFMSIGRLENLVAAQNVQSISLLKSAISALSTLGTIQEADKFKNINGTMTMSNGSANISKINVTGPLMSYYVKGAYNILPNSANLVILGRLDSKVVSVLGVLGQLSADKLLSYIPKIGAATSQILQKLTEDPENENTSLIPSLSTGSKTYKDFKVIFNGPVESSKSVRSFKWLSKCDTSKLDIKQDFKDAKNAVQTNITNQINAEKTKFENVKTNVNNIIETQKKAVQEQKREIEQTKTDIQNVKTNAGQGAVNLGKLFLNAAQNANKTYTAPETKE